MAERKVEHVPKSSARARRNTLNEINSSSTATDSVVRADFGTSPEKVLSWRQTWLPAGAGVLAALGVFAGLFSSMYIPAKTIPSFQQILLAVFAALISGIFATWQVRNQLWVHGVDRYQTCARDLSGVSSRVRPVGLLQLPPDIGDFTGRREEVHQIVAHLASSELSDQKATLVSTISGKGGIGKTALALHAAHRLHDHFPDAQLYTNLRGVEAQALDPMIVLAGFLRELGIADSDIPEHLEDRARMFRARLSGQKTLVVLDNASSEAQVRPLLPGSSGCAALVTSRSRLSGLAGAHTVALEVMTDQQGVDLLRKVIGAERLAQEEDAAYQIAGLCGFLPLALRVAAAKLVSRPSWSLQWFAERLQDERRRLSLLRVGDMEVRASLALSYDACNAQEQHAFRSLGILRAQDFPAWNLAALLDLSFEPAEEILERLVDAELLEASGVDANGLIRYRFHDLLRDYAREKLAESESQVSQRATLHRLVEAYIVMACEAAYALRPGTSQDPTARQTLYSDVARRRPREWFITERRSVVSLVELSSEFGLLDQTWRLVEPLPAMFNFRADWNDWQHTHELGLGAAQESGNKLGQATMRRSLGMLYRELGRFDEAVHEFQEALRLFHLLKDVDSAAAVQCHLGDTYRYQGLLNDAISAFRAALNAFEASGDLRSTAGALNGLADARRGLSQWEESEHDFDKCIAIYRELGDPLEEARAKVRFSQVHRDRCLNPQAESLLAQGLAVFRTAGDRRWEARTLRHLGVVCRNEGRLDKALGYFDDCLPIFEELLDRRGVAVALRNRGDTHRRAEDYDRAQRDLTEALHGFQELEDRRWEARTNLSIADMRRCQRRWLEAEHHANLALAFFRKIRDTPAEGRSLRQIGIILRDRGDYRQAAIRLGESRALFESLGDDLWMARVIASHARLRDIEGVPSDELWSEADETCSRRQVIPTRRGECLAEW